MLVRDFEMTLDPMLASRIADLAREFEMEGDEAQLADESSGPSRDDLILNEEQIFEELDDVKVEPIETELRTLIDGLNVDAQKDLLALVWLGRDGGSFKDWKDVRKQASDTPHLHVAQYLEETPLVSDFLVGALGTLGYENESE